VPTSGERTIPFRGIDTGVYSAHGLRFGIDEYDLFLAVLGEKDLSAGETARCLGRYPSQHFHLSVPNVDRDEPFFRSWRAQRRPSRRLTASRFIEQFGFRAVERFCRSRFPSNPRRRNYPRVSARAVGETETIGNGISPLHRSANDATSDRRPDRARAQTVGEGEKEGT
jgi:hypothetical protein